jgi:hypothetical protein
MIKKMETLSQHVTWIHFQGTSKDYQIRVEQDPKFNNGNLLITVHEDEDSDYKGRLEV